MRFSRYVQLDQVCCTLMEAVDYIQGHDDSDLCQELLDNGTQMLQEFYAVLMQYRSDWKNTKTKDLLDEINCIWQNPLPDTITERLEELRISLKEDIVIQIRAVFFAELGSKWESMASVYSYMCQDPRFDPVVVLTPVFRAKEIDGNTQTEIIYEDYLTEMGIPFQNYWEYMPDEDCPELAFTCQPYESVTIPEFWAENIAKYTRLVYLPYFIPALVNAGNQKSLFNMPIHAYAWRIAGISQKFLEYSQKYSLNKGENLMLTGIPKMDYAIHLRENSCAVPDAWQDKIKDRIVLLWNTWYDAQASSIDLLQVLLPWFQEHQEFALIWRPHPMSKAVLKLYQPEQYRNFEEMINIIDASDNMIFDDGVDYGLAFSCSLAQISDYSGMMFEYLLLNKPVLWTQKPFIRELEQESECMVSDQWMEKAFTPVDVIDFIERIANGEDRNRALREEVCTKELPLADGNAAARICNCLYDDLYRECLGV